MHAPQLESNIDEHEASPASIDPVTDEWLATPPPGSVRRPTTVPPPPPEKCLGDFIGDVMADGWFKD
jgi:hypothetical protein